MGNFDEVFFKAMNEPMERTEYVGGPWCGKVSLLNRIGEPFILADIDTHAYFHDGRTANGDVRYRWMAR